MTYTVRTRYGWGWEVIGRNYQSHPIESAIAAQALADALGAGVQHEDALQAAGLYFRDGRFQSKSV